MNEAAEISKQMEARSTQVLRAGPVAAGEAAMYTRWLRETVSQQANDAARLVEALPKTSADRQRLVAQARILRSSAEDWPPAPAFAALQAVAANNLDVDECRELIMSPAGRLAHAASLEQALRSTGASPSEESFSRALDAWRERCVAAQIGDHRVYEQDLAFTGPMKAMMSATRRYKYNDDQIRQRLAEVNWPASPAAVVTEPYTWATATLDTSAGLQMQAEGPTCEGSEHLRAD